MSFLKLLLAFLPWLSFLVIAHGSLFRLKLGLVVALILSMGNYLPPGQSAILMPCSS